MEKRICDLIFLLNHMSCLCYAPCRITECRRATVITGSISCVNLHNLVNTSQISGILGCFQFCFFFVFIKKCTAILAGIFVYFSFQAPSLKISWGFQTSPSSNLLPSTIPRSGGEALVPKCPVLFEGGIWKNRGPQVGSGGWGRGFLQRTKQQRPGQGACPLSFNRLLTWLKTPKCGHQKQLLKSNLKKIKVITLENNKNFVGFIY